MSKEMIQSKLRARKLNYIIENSQTYIIVPPEAMKSVQTQEAEPTKSLPQLQEPLQVRQAVAKPKATVAAVLSLYQRENNHLKEKILKLEDKIDQLIADKEKMLRDERDKIEQLYNTKDEQLKNILELINKKMLLEHSQYETIHEVESIEEEKETKNETPEPEPAPDKTFVELKEYLRHLDIKSYQKKIIKKRFLDSYHSDIRIIQRNGKLYLDLARYDYTDLLKH
jgi:small-conductance mechanosensitive channel